MVCRIFCCGTYFDLFDIGWFKQASSYRPICIQIFTAGAGKGKPEVVVLDPAGRKDTVPARIIPEDNDTYRNTSIQFIQP